MLPLPTRRLTTESQDSTPSELPGQLATLDAISQLLTESVFNLDALLHEIVRIAAQKLGVKACVIRLLDEATGEMVLKAVYGLSDGYFAGGPVIAQQSSYRSLIESGQVVQIPDVTEEPWRQYFGPEALQEGIRSRLAVGLMHEGRAIGALSVYTAERHEFGLHEIQTFETIANQAAVAINLSKLHRRRLDAYRIEQELEIAARIQRNLLPGETPSIQGLDIAARCHPSAQVGGDFYDFISLPRGNVGIAIGDASGKGIPAALLMSSVSTALRVQAESVYSMREIVSRLNWTLCRYRNHEQFATLFYAVLNIPDRMLTYVNAGHNYPLVFRQGRTMELRTGGRPVGMLADSTYQEDSLRLEAGDLMVLYTDGYTDAANARQEFYDEERLLRGIAESAHLAPGDIIDRVEADIERFRDGADDAHTDDRTMVAIRVLS